MAVLVGMMVAVGVGVKVGDVLAVGVGDGVWITVAVAVGDTLVDVGKRVGVAVDVVPVGVGVAPPLPVPMMSSGLFAASRLPNVIRMEGSDVVMPMLISPSPVIAEETSISVHESDVNVADELTTAPNVGALL